MVEGRRGAGLAVEAIQVAPIRCRVVLAAAQVGDLQGHPPFELRVLGQVDRPHRPLAELLEDPVAAELLGQLDRNFPLAAPPTAAGLAARR